MINERNYRSVSPDWRRSIQGGIERELAELMTLKRPTASTRTEIENLQRDLAVCQKVNGDPAQADADLAAVREAGTGGRIERGTPHDEPRTGDPGNGSWGTTGTRRDRARHALEGLRSVPDAGRERLTRAFDRTEGAQDGGRELDLLSRWLLATSNPDYARAVSKLFRDPMNGHREFDARELAAYQEAKFAQRAMSIGTDSAGGFLLPTHLDPAIMLSNVGVIDPIRELARTETIATDTWNGISSAGVTASWDAEGAEVSDDSPTLAQPSVPTHKGAAFVAASIEAAMDTNIGQQVAALFVDAKMRLEGTGFLDGTGTGQPTGLITSLPAGSKVATATADVLVSADVTKPAVALPPRWQPNASYISNNATAIAIGAFETAGGSLRYGEINKTPPTLLRKRFFEHSGMETAGTTATADNDSVLLLGDFRQYLVVDRVGATVEYIQHLFGAAGRPTGSRGWYLFWRSGGDVLIDDAFRLLTA